MKQITPAVFWRCLVLIVACLAAVGALAYHELVADLPAPDALLSRASAGTTKILDRNGRLLYEIFDPHSGARTRLRLDDVPLYCQQATIATEDAGFYANPGVDLRAIARAAWQNARSGEIVSGGSTLTQQVARMTLMSRQERAERSLRRKLREMILAYRLAQSFSKQEILAMYLNEVYYGQMAYGLEAAAQTYFGVHAHELDLAQCALLAGLPQSPASYNPLVNLDAAKERQKVVLRLMVQAGYLTPQQAELAAAEPLKFNSAGPLLAPHFVAYVRNQLEQELGPQALLAGGLVITTTLDLDLQRAAEDSVARHLANLREQQVTNAAVVVLDPRTGEILAMVGSADYHNAAIDGAVNIALALRQPGSAMKPILYAQAFEQGWSPGDVLHDVPTAFIDESGETYIPANYDNLYHGPVSLRRALANSFNLPAVILQKRIGTDGLLALARAMGLTTLTDAQRYGLTLTLGGGEVRLLDLTAAYGAFATGGYRVTPCSIKASNLPSSTLLLDPRAAFMVTDILSDNDARAEQFGLFSPLHLPFPAAAKTGTTSQWRDNWTVGYTPQRVVGVWVGNADGRPMSHISGVDGAGPIWRDVMLAAHKQLPVMPFTEPPGLERRQVCITNGLTPGPHCPYRRTELYLAESPLRPVETEYALQDGKLVWRAPAELREWARTNGIPFTTTIPNTQRPVALSSPHPVTLASPAPNTRILIDPHVPLAMQQLEVTAVVGDEANTARVDLLMDGAPWVSLDAAPYRAWWTLTPGEHQLMAVAVDRQGNRWPSQTISIVVEEN